MSTKLALRIAAAAASLFLLAGCTGAGSRSAPAVAPAPAGGATEVAADVEKSLPGAGGAADEYVTEERQVARTAAITLVITDPTDAAARVRAVAANHGGLVTREEVRSQPAGATSTVVISVPADQVDAALADLGGIGTMTQRSQGAVDVTEKVVDTDARIRTLQESIARIRGLMDRAGTVTEIATVERELTNRQAELESLLGQQKSLRDRVARTPITVTLTTKAPVAEGNPFLDGLAAAWAAMQDSVRFVLLILGALLPWAILAALIWLPIRWWLKKHPRAPRVRPAGQPWIAFPAQQPVVPQPHPDAAPAAASEGEGDRPTD